MSLRKILLVTAGMYFMLNASAQVSKRYYVAKPGTLVEMLTEDEANKITHLTLQGKLNAIDFRHLRDEFKNLQILDISTASISMYAGKNGTHPDRFYVYPANCIPSYAFCKQTNDSTFTGKTSLTRVILSDKTKNIEDGAFKGCTNLKICQIRKKTPPNLLPEALADSVTAIFVPLGSSDSYRIGKRWETFAFIEGEPVSVAVQIGTMGSLASELIQKGIQPKDVNFLTVEGKMDEADFTLIRNYMPNLVSINLSKSNATIIPDYTFTQKKYLLNISLPHALKSIGQRAFSGCTRLCGTVVLPPSVTAIEYGAFMGCTNLRNVLATGNKITTLGDNIFGEGEDKLIYK
nr:leucine-rich repeat domain-containing protein [uncultured Bacteroides sp.]